MDSQTLVAAVKATVATFKRNKRPFNLVMLIPVDSGVLYEHKFTLLLSALWLDKLSPREATALFIKRMIDETGTSHSPAMQSVARVSIVNTSDPLVRAITTAFAVSNSDMTFENVVVNGLQLNGVILLESSRTDAPAVKMRKHTTKKASKPKSKKPKRPRVDR